MIKKEFIYIVTVRGDTTVPDKSLIWIIAVGDSVNHVETNWRHWLHQQTYNCFVWSLFMWLTKQVSHIASKTVSEILVALWAHE